ncbi:hypothetical protein FGO68_gene11459 [Halteria grandinella]|uniref:Signal peptidase complex subunit 3 n=1 Tax=Halteria grandinella TaxID=5974 RepID=A0A8J8NHY0_HALGN|nr:hypothetical protein FGO68_gene11459 [Halteria grandinella]
MYSLSGRLNTIAFNTLLTLGVLAGMNFLACYPFDFLGHAPRQPTIVTPFKIRDFDVFVKDNYINEDALSFTFDFKVDLRPLFNWNTNLVFAYISCEYNTTKSSFNRVTIWDQRVPRDDEKNHVISLQAEWPEYYLTDINKLLRDQDVTCYLQWEQMPIAGANYGGKMSLGTFRTPKNYISNSRRKYAPGPEGREYNY